MFRKILNSFLIIISLSTVLSTSCQPAPPFERLYAQVDFTQAASLTGFRQEYPPQHLLVDGVDWEYLALGEGPQTVLFLHGLAGAYDVWWQQMLALKDDYRVISVTYPAVDSLEGLAQGILAILDKENVDKASLVGSSLGGYLAQYLLAVHPERVERAVFGNTYADKDFILEEYGLVGGLLPYTPEALVMAVLRASYRWMIYPSSQDSPLVLSYLTEQTFGRTGKAHIESRYRTVIEPFISPDPAALGIPVLILESDNDPLISLAAREDLKATYPNAAVHTFHGVGHFPYLVVPDQFLQVLEDFLRQDRAPAWSVIPASVKGDNRHLDRMTLPLVNFSP
jgi:pimeloyl-ACP methyl ester carboxylesterase